MAGELLRHAGEGVDFGEIDDLGERIVGTDWLPGNDFDRTHQARDGRIEGDARRWMADLSTFNHDGGLPFLHGVVDFNEDLVGAAGYPTADDGSVARINFNATESKDGLREIAGFVDLGCDAKILHPGGVEHDGVRATVRGVGGDQWSHQSQGKKQGERKGFHGVGSKEVVREYWEVVSASIRTAAAANSASASRIRRRVAMSSWRVKSTSIHAIWPW